MEYETAARIEEEIRIEKVREFFGRPNQKHGDPVGKPQEWCDKVLADSVLKLWTNQQAPPPLPSLGWPQDGWYRDEPDQVKA